ncbi:tetratricopeptide repeat protein [Stieleria sp. TO1_6]|uniref:tetratricopeptide repeat protein n=1 Tax=Stieleria tagensis TaxID=2956795 RepID=UPI00209ADC59|nr:tetratricopeptide repeat protein [Stieleria tagensis]MCO8125460.1 tetratricopeptide repeat protein [Stieleria tagensis]
MHFLSPFTWFHWIGEFIRVWFLGIPWRDAPKAIPAIILMIVLFTTGFIAFNNGAGWRNRLLEKQLDVSLEREDYPTAEIVVRRQLEADPNNPDLIYRFAGIREAQAFTEEATVLMKQLMRRRHVPAAKWLLSYEFKGKQWTALDEEQRQDYGLCLQLLHEKEPDNLPVVRMYAEYLLANQRYASAIPLLLQLSKYEPMLGLEAARVARQIGEFDAAKKYARNAMGTVVEMAKDDPTNARLAMAVARNQLFLDEHLQAIHTLKTSAGVAKTKEDRNMLTQAIGEAIVQYINKINVSPSNTIKQRLRIFEMLNVAVKIAPNNSSVISMVADHVLNSLQETDQELVSVREALINGAGEGIAHFIRGTAALMKEDQKLAELHLGLAAELMPRSGAILNNLAVALAMRENPDFEKALQVSSAAIEQVGEPTPHFYETRGQILFRMGRLREAIPDLERTLVEPSLAGKSHRMLADCYDKVGDTELASSHRQAANQLAKVAQ